MEIDQGLLHRMQRAVVSGEMLDGEDLAAVQGADELDAAIDRLVAQGAPSTGRTRTTVQAPQSPSLQPSLVPTSLSSRRR